MSTSRYPVGVLVLEKISRTYCKIVKLERNCNVKIYDF